MVDSIKVKPRRWTNLRVLSDDGDFAYCYGYYRQDDGSVNLALGGRWNGDPTSSQSIGYPNLAGHPTWFVLDPTMSRAILSELEGRAISSGKYAALEEIIKARKAFRV